MSQMIDQSGGAPFERVKPDQAGGPKNGSFAQTLTMQTPAMIVALHAAGAFENPDDRPLHEIETYGPVGFDFVGLEEVNDAGPFVISPDILDAVFDGEVDIASAMQPYWEDIPNIYPQDTPADDRVILGLVFENIDDFDLSFGVTEDLAAHWMPEDDDAFLPITDDFVI